MENTVFDFGARIKKVYPTHGGLEYVILTDGGKYTLTGADFRRIGEDVLFAGNMIDSNLAEDLEFSSEKLSCIQKALKHLEYSAMSERKLRMKLYGKFPREVMDAAIDVMKDNGYIDDERLAMDLCEEYFVHCQAGPAKIKAKLYQKGFSRETVSFVFEEYEFSDDVSQDNMKELLRRKYGDSVPEEEKRKAMEYLVRCGYSYEDAGSVLRVLY